MARKTIMAALVAATTAAAAFAGNVCELNFNDATAVQDASVSNNPNRPNERASGKILSPLTDNSGWCEVWTEYDIVKEGGVVFQRIEVTRIQPKDENDRSTVGQIMIRIPNLEVNKSYRLKLKARSSTSSDMRPMVRVRPSPYTRLWGTRIELEPDWRQHDFEFDLEAEEDTPVALYFQFPQVGTVDIAELTLEKSN